MLIFCFLRLDIVFICCNVNIVYVEDYIEGKCVCSPVSLLFNSFSSVLVILL